MESRRLLDELWSPPRLRWKRGGGQKAQELISGSLKETQPPIRKRDVFYQDLFRFLEGSEINFAFIFN